MNICIRSTSIELRIVRSSLFMRTLFACSFSQESIILSFHVNEHLATGVSQNHIYHRKEYTSKPEKIRSFLAKKNHLGYKIMKSKSRASSGKKNLKKDIPTTTSLFLYFIAADKTIFNLILICQKDYGESPPSLDNRC